MTNSAESAKTGRTYVPYSSQLEQRLPDEEEQIAKIVMSLHWNNKFALRKYKHAIRDAHAKSHGILSGELTVHKDLDPHLRQGLFATPATYPVIARLSSTSGAIRSDQLRGVRGLGIKVLGVEGEREPDTGLPGEPATTQDFVLVTHREFPFADVRAYASRGMLAARILALLPDTGLRVISGLASAVGNVGLPLPETLALFTQPNTQILGDVFYSSAPLRYGDYVAKIAYTPLSDSVKALMGAPVPRDAGRDAHRDMVVQFFECNSAEYELSVQLCTDPVAMPIENAAVEWSQTASPYQGVAKITFDVQDADSPARRAYGDDALSFNSWRTLTAHRPLGSINRLKKEVYEASSRFRHEMNNVPRTEPTNIAELPG